MGAPRTRPPAPAVTLDAGALIALDRGDRRMIALILQALSENRSFFVPAGVIGQAWRDGRRQAVLSRFLRSEEVNVVPLDERLSRAAGQLCGATGTADVIDASVIIVARERRDLIVTSDPNDLRRLDPSAAIVSI
jgi:predicted nucleic acid-binding protein